MASLTNLLPINETPKMPKNPGRAIPISAQTAQRFQHLNTIPPAGTQRTLPANSSSADTTTEDKPPNPMDGAPRRGCATKRITRKQKETIAKEISTVPLYSPSVIKQTEKTERLYAHYCKEQGLNPSSYYPISLEIAEGFLVWLKQSRRFTVHSIRTVILNSLIRLNMLNSGTLIDPYVLARLKTRINAFKRDPTTKPPTGGDEALIPDDIYRIIMVMDPRDPYTAKVASMLLFGLCTGCRGSTMREVLVEDLLHFQEMPDGSGLLTFRLRYLKLHPQESIELSISGYVSEEFASAIDPLFWINRHVMDLTGFPLISIAGKTELPSGLKRRRLWDWMPDDMTQIIKRRMEWVGLPSKRIGVHSLRHGFICTAKLVQSAKGASSASVMTDAAILAVWEAFSKTQFGYIKNLTRRLLSVSNFIGLTATQTKGREASFVRAGESSPHINSLDFHQCPDPPPRFYTPTRSYGLTRIKTEFSQLLHVSSASQAANDAYVNREWNFVLKYTSENALKEAEVNEDKKRSLDSIIKSEGGLSPTFRSPRRERVLGMILLDHKLKQEGNCYSKTAHELKTIVEHAGRIPTSLPEPQNREFILKGTAPEIITRSNGMMVGKRRDWSKEENNIFRDCLRSHTTLAECASKLHIRTPKHVSAHLTILNRHRRRSGKPPLHFRRQRKKNRRLSADGESDEEIDLSTSELYSPSETDSSDLSTNELIEPTASGSDSSSSSETLHPEQESKEQNPLPPIPIFTTVRPYTFPPLPPNVSTSPIISSLPTLSTSSSSAHPIQSSSSDSSSRSRPPSSPPTCPQSIQVPSSSTLHTTQPLSQIETPQIPGAASASIDVTATPQQQPRILPSPSLPTPSSIPPNICTTPQPVRILSTPRTPPTTPHDQTTLTPSISARSTNSSSSMRSPRLPVSSPSSVSSSLLTQSHQSPITSSRQRCTSQSSSCTDNAIPSTPSYSAWMPPGSLSSPYSSQSSPPACTSSRIPPVPLQQSTPSSSYSTSLRSDSYPSFMCANATLHSSSATTSRLAAMPSLPPSPVHNQSAVVAQSSPHLPSQASPFPASLLHSAQPSSSITSSFHSNDSLNPTYPPSPFTPPSKPYIPQSYTPHIIPPAFNLPSHNGYSRTSHSSSTWSLDRDNSPPQRKPARRKRSPSRSISPTRRRNTSCRTRPEDSTHSTCSSSSPDSTSHRHRGRESRRCKESKSHRRSSTHDHFHHHSRSESYSSSTSGSRSYRHRHHIHKQDYYHHRSHTHRH